jgi:ABC-type glutathione transport system ATPase component
MQKRVGLARAICAEPEIIFFDEPTTGLDPIMAGVINALIRQIVTEMGATAITITHDMTSVRAIADDVAMLHAARSAGPACAGFGRLARPLRRSVHPRPRHRPDRNAALTPAIVSRSATIPPKR